MAKELNRGAQAVPVRRGRYRGVPLVDAFEAAGGKFRRKLDEVDFSVNRQGELRVIRALRALVPQVVFDVGAHEGDWSRQMSKLYPECAIHAFEVVPATFARLVANTCGLRAVVANRVGLSDEASPISIDLSVNATESSPHEMPCMTYYDVSHIRTVQARAITGTGYLAEHGIDRIDFLKIDAAGMDLKVIRGFGDRLSTTRAIQFEYGTSNIAPHDPLSDFCSYLSDRGFVVGKILPHSVAWFDYYFAKELFHGGKFLAIRAEERYLIASLGKLGAP